MKFLELTKCTDDITGEKTFVNLDKIESIDPYSTCTMIHMELGRKIIVREKYIDITNAITSIQVKEERGKHMDLRVDIGTQIKDLQEIGQTWRMHIQRDVSDALKKIRQSERKVKAALKGAKR